MSDISARLNQKHHRTRRLLRSANRSASCSPKSETLRDPEVAVASFESCCRLPVFCERASKKKRKGGEGGVAAKGEKRRRGDAEGGGGGRGELRYREGGRRVPRTPGHRTSKVRARGNTRARMPPMPRQRRTECVPAGRRPRGTSARIADEAAGRGKLTFNMGPSRFILSARLRTSV